PRLHALAHVAHRPQADRDDDADFLGERNEAVGTEHAHAWMAPPQQRFETRDAPGAESDLRLVVHLELVALEGVTQARLHRKALLRDADQVRGVERMAIAPL